MPSRCGSVLLFEAERMLFSCPTTSANVSHPECSGVTLSRICKLGTAEVAPSSWCLHHLQPAFTKRGKDVCNTLMFSTTRDCCVNSSLQNACVCEQCCGKRVHSWCKCLPCSQRRELSNRQCCMFACNNPESHALPAVFCQHGPHLSPSFFCMPHASFCLIGCCGWA